MTDHATAYTEFLRKKIPALECSGFDPVAPLNAALFDWQKLIVLWALRRGRAALFEDCGLGKTLQQLEWGQQVHWRTNKETANSSILILCPLAVAQQTVREGEKFGYQVTHCRQPEDVRPGLNITNYERLELFDSINFAGVILDESSILKSFNGTTRRLLTDRFAQTPYRLCCTATPAPNDFTELGQHAEFLGICKPAEMLATYFVNDTFDTGTWRLKGHAVDEFWKWVSSWAVCVGKPSDLGFPDEGFDLPPVNLQYIDVETDQRADPASGELIRNTNISATAIHAENRRTLQDRAKAVAAVVNGSEEPFIVWCETNDESNELTLAIPDAIEVIGSDKPEHKEKKLELFSSGQKRVIVTKASIAGFGLNWQHCRNEIYASLNHSFERYYQAGKRIHRFGQKREVNRYIIRTNSETGALASIQRKAEQHEQMRELMKFTRENLLTPEANKFTVMNEEIEVQQGEQWTAYLGDCVRAAKLIASESVGFTVFSPPFADLFTYSNDLQDMGNCRSLDEFMEHFGFLVGEIGRVTMPGRHCAVHCCDLLATKWKDGAIEFKDFTAAIERAFCGDADEILKCVSSAWQRQVVSTFKQGGWLLHSRVTIWKSPVTEMQRTKAHGLLYKTLCKDSAGSRVGAPDYLLVFRKRGENPVPITHGPDDLPLDRWQELASPVWWTVNQTRVLNGEVAREERDERHICPLQLDVIERALTLWSAPGDLVYSPFGGIGSEGFCALKAGRRAVTSELKRSYFEQLCTNFRNAAESRYDLFNQVVNA